MEFRIEGLTISVDNMEPMIQFYSELFGCKFEHAKEISVKLGTDLFYTLINPPSSSNLSADSKPSFRILFCPTSISGVMANQNRQQWDIVVEDLKSFTYKLEKAGGKLSGEVINTTTHKVCTIIDPDGNTLVIKEYYSR